MITTAVLFASVALQAPNDTLKADTVVRLKELTITATRSALVERLSRAEAMSLVVPELSDRGGGLVTAHLLQDVPGAHVQQTSAGQGAVILRGLVGNQVLYLVDGVPMNNGTYRDGPGQYLATIDPETIERIEVVRGPASVLYGSDAQGGVVNLITQPHPFRGQTSVRVAGNGSTADRGGRARVSAGAMGGRWSLALGGTLQSAGDLRAGDGLGPQVPTGFEAYGLDGRFTYLFGHEQSLTASFQHFQMDDVPRFDRYVSFRATEGLGADAEHRFDPQTRQLGYARYRLARGTGALAGLEVTASLSIQREGRSRIRRLVSGAPSDTRERWRDDVYTPGVSVVGSSIVPAGDRALTLTWGGEFYHDALESRGFEDDLQAGTTALIVRESANGPAIPTGNFPDGASGNRMGSFLSAEIQLFPAIALSAGARWSRFRNVADVGTQFGSRVENVSSDVTGQLGVVVAPHARWRVAARLAEGFRAPNLYDLTRVGPVPGGIAVPNPSARPERSLSVDLSLRYGDPVSAFDVTVYTMTIDGFIDRAPGVFRGDTLFNGERVFQAVNVGSARVRGLEIEGIRFVGPVRLRTSAFYTYGAQEDASGITEPMSKIPPLNGTASVRWMFAGQPLWVEYLLRWATKQTRLGSRDSSDPRIPSGGTPGYAVHGVRAGARVAPDVNVSAGLENVTDELYRGHASGVDSAGRHVWVGLSWVGSF